MKVLNSYELQDKGSVMKTIARTKKEKVTWKEFFQVVMAIAFPIAIQNLLGTTASMVDTIMIGSQGELAVAAVLSISIVIGDLRVDQCYFFPSTGVQGTKKELTGHLEFPFFL